MKRRTIFSVPILAVLLGAWAFAGQGLTSTEKRAPSSSGHTAVSEPHRSTSSAGATSPSSLGGRDEQRYGVIVREVLEMIRRDNPDRYNELVRLREREPEAFKAQLQEIILQRLQARRQERLERAQQPEVAGKTEPGKYGRPPAAPSGAPATAATPANAGTAAVTEAPAAGGERRGLKLERFLDSWRTENPEGFNRLKELRAKDPAKFRDEARQTFESKYGEYRAKMFGSEDHSAELAARFRQANTPEERQQAVQQLRQSIYASFDKQPESQQQTVEHLESQVAAAKQKLAERKAQREDICRKRFEYLYLSTMSSGETKSPAAATQPKQ